MFCYDNNVKKNSRQRLYFDNDLLLVHDPGRKKAEREVAETQDAGFSASLKIVAFYGFLISSDLILPFYQPFAEVRGNG